jgi:hypothetical protein
MNSLKDRMSLHAEKIQRQEELEAELEGVFSQETQAARDRFAALVRDVVKPAFDEFKLALRELKRDAVIISNLSHNPQQSIGLRLVDRYLSFGKGKTLNLVNPKEDIAKVPNSKFYEISRSDNFINIRQRVDPHMGPITTQVGYIDVSRSFVENELAAFFERAYPTGS